MIGWMSESMNLAPAVVAIVDGHVPNSPIAVALLGLSAGQSTECDFPDGSRRRLTLKAVRYQPERVRRYPAAAGTLAIRQVSERME